MGLMEDLEDEVAAAGFRCPVGRLLDNMTAEDRAVLEAALARPKEEMPNAAISRVLDRRDLYSDARKIGDHRASPQRCSCKKGKGRG